MRRAAIALLAVLATPLAGAADLVGLEYDPAGDALVVDVVYLGTNAKHDFAVQWGRCSDEAPYRVVGRLIDMQGTDVAREEYRVRDRIGLERIPCRPARVTLRLGRVAHANVLVPAR